MYVCVFEVLVDTFLVSPDGSEGEVGAAGDEGRDGVEEWLLLPSSGLARIEAMSGERQSSCLCAGEGEVSCGSEEVTEGGVWAVGEADDGEDEGGGDGEVVREGVGRGEMFEA